MFKVYIADDEIEVRTGLKKIINWESLDFKVCGEAGNGLTAFNEIISLQPDLVLLDIRMPKLQGLDVASKLRETGFNGHIIVLSGYSEFKYAQEAIKHDVDFYLTKPIEEEELSQAVVTIREDIKKSKLNFEQQNYYQKQAKHKILRDLLNGKSGALSSKRIKELDLHTDFYKVIVAEYLDETNGFKDICECLQVPQNSGYIEKFKEKKVDILLLMGSLIINKFDRWKERVSQDRESVAYISEGELVSDINKIKYSYDQALVVLGNRFFMDEYFVVASIKDVPVRQNNIHSQVNAKIIGERLYENIVVLDIGKCSKTISQLRANIINSRLALDTIKSLLTGMYISVTNKLKTNYQNQEFKFVSNEEIINWTQDQVLLDVIIQFMYSECERVIKLIKGTSSESITEEIKGYLNHHFKEDIKLKLVAEKFGYSSPYLGKLFRKKQGISFNDYLHQVRIDEAKVLLLDERLKVYEVAGLVGYKNVDYFHLKFKELIDCTPNEYRVNNLIDVIEE